MASKKLACFKNKIEFIHDNFSNIKQIVSENGIEKVDGILLDLGMSSFQIDDTMRGFSYMNYAPLDMRMDKSNKISAFDVVNSYSFEANHKKNC